MTRSTPRHFWTLLLVLLAAASAAAFAQTLPLYPFYGNRLWHIKMALILGAVTLGFIFSVILLLRGTGNLPFQKSLETPPSAAWTRPAGLLLFALSFPFLWTMNFDFMVKPAIPFLLLTWSWLVILAMQAAGLRLLTKSSWTLAFALALLTDGVLFQAWFIFQPVSDYPFSLGWSEASRFYYGSLPFSRSVYGEPLPLSFMHGTRYFLLSLAFLFGTPSLWAARLWQAVLWIVTNGLAAFFLVRRLKWESRALKLLAAGWFFLFLFQGAVYYHLLVCVILVLAGVDTRRPLRSLAVVALASFWAGMSRVNWYPVPAMLAITLHLLETPFSRGGGFWKYFLQPILWTVTGLALAFAGQFFYIAISGVTDLSVFSSSFTSALLWYRWWPNATNPLGVIPGLLLISLPPFVLLFRSLRGQWTAFHPWRWLGILAMGLVLLGGGLVVSTKIGGGGDLHNMDAYIVLLGLVTIYFTGRGVQPESEPLPGLDLDLPALFFALLFIPAFFSLSRVLPPITYDHAAAADDLKDLRRTVEKYSAQGEVLFIYERQLLTFGMIPDVRVVPEDEVVSLIEMAISGNQPNLDKFYQDLRSHRFAAIVSHKSVLKADNLGGSFSEEADAWNSLILAPMLCEYEPVLSLKFSKIQVLVPRAQPCGQP